MTCRRYGQNGKDFYNKEGENVQKFNYCDKHGHVKEKKIKEQQGQI